MMRNETEQILDDLLSRWHAHCKGFSLNTHSADPTFRHALRAKGEQTLEAISEDEWLAGKMKAMDFHILGDKNGQGGMEQPYRTAILFSARNCYTGREVWLSPRLPQDREARKVLVLEARVILLRRLIGAGVV